MKYSWFKTVIPIATLFSFRLLGVFLLIPVFSVYALKLKGASPALIGFALGGYGLTQALLQMPFGWLSDRFGRKEVITFGLLLFISGSLLGAYADSIVLMILARVLQGSGAVGSVLIALLADLTSQQERTRAMAVIGMSIGFSFAVAMVLGPFLAAHFGLGGVFYCTSLLAFVGLILLFVVIPNPRKESFHADAEAMPSLFYAVLGNKALQMLNMGIFFQHFILTSTFFVLPLILMEPMQAGYLKQTWHFYLFLMLGSFVIMLPCILLAEKRQGLNPVFWGAVFLTAVSQGILALVYQSWYSLCALAFAYFAAFNILEALLPSLVSQKAQSNNKGTAMGVYSTSQFLGLFSGGVCAGVLYPWGGSQGVFLMNACLACFWLLLFFKQEKVMV